MKTAINDFTQLLSNDTCHSVNRFEEDSDSLRYLRDLDPVPGTQKDHHGFANYSTKTQQDCRYDP